MAEGETRIANFSTAEDCRTTLRCLEVLGVRVTRFQNVVTITGVGKTGFRKPDQPLDCGNSGTTARLLAGLLAGQAFDSVLTGDESLSARPMGRIIEPLDQMGAAIHSSDGKLPIHFYGSQRLVGIEYEQRVASAQVKSCLLLAGLLADGRTTVADRTPTRDHTERMLRWLGAEVAETETAADRTLSVSGGSALTARDIDVPADTSSAVFFFVAGACLKGSDVTMPGVGLNPTRSAIIDIVRELGGNIEVADERENSNEPRGTVRVSGGLIAASANNLVRDGIIPKIIDEVPALAVFGTQIEGGIEIRDAAELRHKETDRISAIVENLRRMNATVEEFPDGFRIERSDLKGAVVDSFGDHRIAMAFAVAGLLADGETEIENAQCVDISFPGFFDTLAEAVR